MERFYRIILSRCHEKIVQDLDYNLVCAHLICQDALDWNTHHIIESKGTNEAKAEALISLLRMKGPSAFRKFLSALSVAEYTTLIEEMHRTALELYR